MYEIETISVEIDREGSPQFMKQLLTFISNLLLEYTGYISHDNFFSNQIILFSTNERTM